MAKNCEPGKIPRVGDFAPQPTKPEFTLEQKRLMRQALIVEKEIRRANGLNHQLAAGDKICFSVAEAALSLGVSEWTIRKELSREQLRSCRIRGRHVIPRWELERYVHEHTPRKNSTQTMDEPHSG
jgi:excisionase family DNA binding protein